MSSQVSTNKQIGASDEGGERTVEDLLAADGWRPDEVVEATLDLEKQQISMRNLLVCLKPRYRKIVEMRYGLTEGDDKEYTTAEIGEQLELSVQRVSQISNMALDEMKEYQVKLDNAAKETIKYA